MGTLRVGVEGEGEGALDTLAAVTGSRSRAVRYALLSTFQEVGGG